jgi:hypothetical protein
VVLLEAFEVAPRVETPPLSPLSTRRPGLAPETRRGFGGSKNQDPPYGGSIVSSLCLQRNHRVESHRTARGQGAGDDAGSDQHDDDAGKRQITRAAGADEERR